ncbi:hypothetical protein Peur_018545 [Populus x canadensis]
MLYHFVFNSLYVSKAVEVGNNSVVHQADRVVAEEVKTLQDRISNKKRMNLKNSANGSKIDLLASESVLMQEMVG